ncbi:multidrug resistance-associated 1 [Fusarium sp. NRRL 52700]|nr:multidrug resistance-associated 1 [Fusarium sp. NRRL 52700]
MRNSDQINRASSLFNTIFSILILLRLWRLRNVPIKIIPEYFGLSSLIIAGLLLFESLYSLAINFSQKDLDLASVSVSSFIAAAILCLLLYMEYMRSTRSADLAVLFLLLSVGFDVAIAITEGSNEWLIPTTKIAPKLLLVATESRSKQRILKSPYSSQAPEELAGILTRVFFWWINPILTLGNRKILSGDDLPPIDQLLRSEKLRRDGLWAWDQRARPLSNITLPVCLAKSMLPQFMAPIILRLCLIFFRYAQPALISSVVHILSSDSHGGRLMLIIKAATVYFGLAIFEALYQHRLNRLSIMVKGTLVGLINNTALRQPIANSTKHFDLADWLILLEKGRMKYQRSPNDIHEAEANLRQTHVSAAVAGTTANLAEPNKTIQSQALELHIGGYLILSLLAWTATNGSMWFSEDMQLVDKSLPPAILSLSNQVFKLLVQATLLFSAQKLLAATLPICILVVYVVQRVYLRTSRQLRLLQLESQSAVYSSFLESSEGLVNIRSFGWVKQAENYNMQCLDNSQQSAYILLCLQLWLNIVLDLVIAAMAVILVALAVFSEGSTTAGQIGMSLNIVLVANSTLLALVTSWTNLEISLGAISRLKTLEADTVTEEQPPSGAIVPDTWPSLGAVEIRDLTVTYDESHVPALKNINLFIEPGQYLVICGRTGRKSTLLLALLRLLTTQSGFIEVDGIDLSMVPLSIIRERCSITVTQDPFLLAQASLRFNLDPTETLSDSVIIKALERTGLCAHFDTNPKARLVDILNDPLSSLPHMSTGQTQLFALTRAILRVEHSSITGTKPILLLDEATSSVDGVTESVMRGIIKEVFTDNGHTVIEITHRLSGYEDIASTGGESRPVKVVLLSQGEIQSQGRIEDMLDFGKTV